MVNKLINWIKNLFLIEVKIVYVDKLIPEEGEWFEFEKEKPRHEVVLVACDTYDCGWVIDTAWWHEEKHCWMITGSRESQKAHLPYTHWRKMPSPPKKNKT